MMVTFVSQCEKNALKKTRRVLDAFANRIGNSTWQTLITEDGLLTVKKMLRQTASKSTAVSCHWIRSRARSQLLWVVGKKDRFNDEGYVPVNSTRRNLLKNDIENDWQYLPLIKALVAVAALLHDWGKATKLFQDKLDPKKKVFKGDPIRHEWISLLLLHAFVSLTESKQDQDWLTCLSEGKIDEKKLKQTLEQPPSHPFSELPPIAKLVAWLIVSHHRLPLPKHEQCRDYLSEHAESLDILLARVSKEWGYENRFDEKEYQQRVKDCFVFPKGMLSQSKLWIRQVKKWTKRLLESELPANNVLADGSYRVVILHARLCLMLGDHLFSSKPEKDLKWQGTIDLHANTYIDPQSKRRAFKQKLDEHLVGVAQKALNAAHLLPAFERELPLAENIQSLRKLSPKAFQWQDKAVEKISQWRQTNGETKKYGCFVVNMASTGCGKTFANAKVIRALSDDAKSLRFILALGLRTLTLQTGDEYRKRIFDKSEEHYLAVLIGSRAVMELHQQNKLEQEKNSYESSGSASQELLIGEELDTACDIPEHMLSTVLSEERDKQFLYVPVLTCTIDHLMAATETKRGGRYILPTLRLMSSDLVIDEIDDFTGDDLIAIGRLIHLAGMLGRKVMISSATIPPFLAEGYFKAYRDGWQLYCKTRSASQTIDCIWIDEFATEVVANNGPTPAKAVGQYRQEHKAFADKRITELAKQPAKRKADISSCETIIEGYKNKSHKSLEVVESKRSAYFKCIAESAIDKHKCHNIKDPDTRLKVSFGVIRVANINPCVALTTYLLEHNWPDNIDVRVMAYHSQQVLLMRSEQEKHLDQVLKREDKQEKIQHTLYHPLIRSHLQKIKQHSSTVKNVLFILVATPVEEVGRDHDFDWAVIEPSSYRSFIQLAGRVRRHREGEVAEANIALMQYNLKGLLHHSNPEKPVFVRPGFEDLWQLESHDLAQLVDTKKIANALDAIPRIRQPEDLTADTMRAMRSAKSLIELEHVATWYWLANYKTKGKGAQTGPNTLQGWLNHRWFLSALPQQLSPFRKSEPSLKIFLTFDEYQQASVFCEKDEQGYAINREALLNIQRFELSDEAKRRLWLVRDFDIRCAELANEQKLTQRIISLRYGELNFPWQATKRYKYNDQLGLVKI